ncbi:MAG: chromosome segregation protein SMC, partial [Gammaproteobacteria bacterium]|nr:chromosome segregation protein SMC [Gammaproteobacteria bacterium]
EVAARVLEAISEQIRALRKQDSSLSSKLDELRDHLQRDRGRLSSLEALQEAALGKLSTAAENWLAATGRREAPRLATQIQVESGWERAVEGMLAGYLNAIGLDDIDALADDLADLSESGIAVYEQSGGSSDAAVHGLPSLASKLERPLAARALLDGVLAAETLAQALRLRTKLAPGQSIVTSEGVQVTRHGLKTHASDDPQLGVIARSEEIERLQRSVADLTAQSETTAAKLQAARTELDALETRHADEQNSTRRLQLAHADTRTELETCRTRSEEVRRRIAVLDDDVVALDDERHMIEQAIAAGRRRLEAAVAEREAQAAERQKLDGDRGASSQRLTELRAAAAAAREKAKEIAIMVETRRSSKQSASAALTRVQAQRRYLIERRQGLAKQLDELKAPLEEEKRVLEARLDERLKVESALAEARSAVEACEDEVRAAEAKRVDFQQAVGDARDGAEAARMRVREIEVRADTVREQFARTGFDQEQLKSELPPEATAEEWSERLESIGRKIQRLGAINLAAIEEFEEKSERKQYLDKQFEDLSSALETLEAAIRKIDGETRSRFRETFNRANQGLGELFPRLFGGGNAYLELDSEDLLSAGVTVMARPPGKRISTIHLLSGGEKALTAVALVFAIFKLNPAPFCLLDEVDAPLDDANVGRFSDIVREMSDHVQFVLITHNKTTMEAMSQLTGVTMNEPGVSRLVAVDIDEAVQLAAM